MTPPASEHFNGKTFFQAGSGPRRMIRDVLKWRLTSRPTPWPQSVPLRPQPVPSAPTGSDLVVTWLGHASFLIQTAAGNVLIDPAFSERVSPVQWAGPRRVHPLPFARDELPRIDAVCVSHDHYDHCDAPTLRWLARRSPATVFLAPLRHDDLLRRAGARRIETLDWWETRTLPGGTTVRLTPTKHWSNRFGTPRNHRLWGGFFLEARGRTVWYVGDSGYAPELFREIRTRTGAPDVALVPIGAYEPRWFMKNMHMNPEEAVQLHRESGAQLSVAMHWGTFQLTDEGRDEPVRALREALRRQGVDATGFRVLEPGESVTLPAAARSP